MKFGKTLWTFLTFYSIDVCQSHFTGNNSKNCIHKDETKMETNLGTTKTIDEATIPKYNTTVKNPAENISKIHLDTDNRRKTDKNKSIVNIDDSLLKKNNSIYGINMTVIDTRSTEKQQIVTEKMVKLADDLDNQTASRGNNKLIVGPPKIDRVEKHNIALMNDITTETLQNNDNLTMISKRNGDMTQKIQQYDNMTIIVQKNNNINKTAEEKGFLKNLESKNNDSPKNIKKRDIGMPEQARNNYNLQDFQKHVTRNNQNYDVYENIKNYDMPKNIHQYDPRNITQKYRMAKKVHGINDFRPYYQNYGIKYKNIIDNTDPLKKDEHIRINDDRHKIIPQIQTRLNNELVKKSFDEFKMVRRKTHFTLPDTQSQNDISKREIERYQDLNYNPKFYDYDYEGKIKRPRNHVELNYNAQDIPNNIIYSTGREINPIIYPVYGEDIMPNKFRELNKLLGRQKEIIEKLTKQQRVGKQDNKRQTDFANIMSEVEALQNLKNRTKFTFIPTTTTRKLTTTVNPSTMLALFDETEVRLALKKDPNVRRILKLGNLKREHYLKRVKIYMKRNKDYKKMSDRRNGVIETVNIAASPVGSNTDSNELIETITIAASPANSNTNSNEVVETTNIVTSPADSNTGSNEVVETTNIVTSPADSNTGSKEVIETTTIVACPVGSNTDSNEVIETSNIVASPVESNTDSNEVIETTNIVGSSAESNTNSNELRETTTVASAAESNRDSNELIETITIAASTAGSITNSNEFIEN